eukprot:4974321-Amphidinium_carterae.1
MHHQACLGSAKKSDDAMQRVPVQVRGKPEGKASEQQHVCVRETTAMLKRQGLSLGLQERQSDRADSCGGEVA